MPDTQSGQETEYPPAARPNASTDGSAESASTEKNTVKQMLYEALCAITGRTLPWGALTGIRPTKIATQMLSRGDDDNTIIDYLKTVHFVSAEKAALSLEIAHRERAVLSSHDFENGYSLYVGIPFCPTRCSYCSFAAYPLRVPGRTDPADGHTEYLKSRYASRVEAYMDALEKELAETSALMRGVRLDTVYIGGGTPTALPHAQLRRLLQFLRESFDFRDVREFTVEAGRPDSILDAIGKLATLREFGVDRVCVNPQTFSQKTLDRIGRGHTVEQTVEAFHLTRDAGFDNINMDIILGLPGETEEDVRHTIEEIGKLGPDDLTIHSLAIKRGSRLAEENDNRGDNKRTVPVYSSLYSNMSRIAEEGARGMGLKPYYLYRQKNMTGNMENTGFARPGKEGLTNILGMEEVHSIVACGAGAITKRVWNVPEGHPDRGLIKRCGNVRELDQYIMRIDEMSARKRALFSEGAE
ncbi:MAG: coproporphyrinogen dehydrogenase HemZ [Butyrivibrio sp.]|nr:coproporphyrinogen dehydrogenase HemZ [Butyrivibrio sp.]